MPPMSNRRGRPRRRSGQQENFQVNGIEAWLNLNILPPLLLDHVMLLKVMCHVVYSLLGHEAAGARYHVTSYLLGTALAKIPTYCFSSSLDQI